MKRIFVISTVLLIICTLLFSGCSLTVKPQTTPGTHETTSNDFSVIPHQTPAPTLKPFDHNSIRMVSVDSSSLASVGYDANYSVLKVQFKNSGEYYIYYDVPQSTYTELLNAESIGSYFYYNVRTSFKYEKVS